MTMVCTWLCHECATALLGAHFEELSAGRILGDTRCAFCDIARGPHERMHHVWVPAGLASRIKCIAHNSAVTTHTTAPPGPNLRARVRGLWRMHGVEGGKYLVLRRDGSVFEHPCFVLGARDPCAPMALNAYAADARLRNFDAVYVADVERLADEFEQYRGEHGTGDPTAPPERADDPATVALMKRRGM